MSYKECLRMFKEYHIHFHKARVGSCCKFLLEKEENVIDLMDSENLENVRSEYLKGRPIDVCSDCIAQDKYSNYSHRTEGNRVLDKYLVEDLHKRRLDYNSTSPLNYRRDVMTIAFSNTCNLKCIYCKPSLSSKWAKEIDSHGPYELSYPFNENSEGSFIKETNNPHIEAFWKRLPKDYKDLRILTVIGGEPTLSRNFWKLLSFFQKNKNDKLILGTTTNLMLRRQVLERLVSNLESIEGNINKFTLYSSIDTHGADSEYIRNGLDYNLFMGNLEYLVKRTKHLSVELGFSVTVNALSITGFPTLLEEIFKIEKLFSDKRFRFEINILHYPKFLSVSIHDPNKIVDVLTNFKNQMEYINKKYNSNIDVMSIISSLFYNPGDISLRRKDFKKYILELDRRRGTDFKSIFPEFSYLLDR